MSGCNVCVCVLCRLVWQHLGYCLGVLAHTKCLQQHNSNGASVCGYDD